MISSRLLLALLVALLGCLITRSSAAPADAKPKGGGGGGEGGQETGTAEQIKEKPEDTKGYVNWGNGNFAGVQNIMDGHFMKKKKEGDQITKYGDKSRKENEVMQSKVEEGQYNTMYHSFKWAEGEMAESTKEAAKSDDDDAGADEGGAGASGGAKAPPKAAKKEPEAEAAPAADDDDE